MVRSIFAGVAALALLSAAPAAAQSKSMPDNWDGLVKVKAKKLDMVYLQPQADFRGYTKVMIDPTEVAFRKNWQRDVNEQTPMMDRVSDEDARKILDEAQKGFQKLFAEAYTKAGYQVVDAPGKDVLRLSTGIINIDVTAPDTMSAGRTRTYSRDAGEATLVLEARDSLTGSLLGRAVDRQETDENAPYIRNSVTNSAEFEEVFARWAKMSAEGLTELKSLSPVDTAGMQKK